MLYFCRTGEQERQFEQICIRILNFRYHCHDVKDTMTTLKNEKPKVVRLLHVKQLYLAMIMVSKRKLNVFHCLGLIMCTFILMFDLLGMSNEDAAFSHAFNHRIAPDVLRCIQEIILRLFLLTLRNLV